MGSRGRIRIGIFVILIVGVAMGGPSVATGAPTDGLRHGATPIEATPGPTVASGDISYIRAETTMDLTPSVAGEVDATIRFTVPENVDEFTVIMGTVGEVSAVDGFSANGSQLDWDGETTRPSIELTVVGNRTSANAPEVVRDGFTFVDTGRWAIVPVPRFGARWSYTGTPVQLASHTTAATEGVVGPAMAYLGPHEVAERERHGQRLRLVVPASAELAEPADRILDVLGDASGRLDIGARDSTVMMIAAPSGIDWGLSGLQLGERDAWVLADAGLETTDNVWLHEYVHTRQELQTTRSTRWLLEGTANYYAALLAYEMGLVSYEEFRTMLANGAREPAASAILSDPETWSSGLVPYNKGALVSGAVDRQVRTASDGGVSLETVVTRLNRAEHLEPGAVVETVRTLAGDGAAEFTHRYVQTDAAPDTWSEQAHREAFDAGPAFRYRLADPGLHVLSPYRNVTFDTTQRLVVHENVVATVRVSNEGDVAGPFSAVIRVNGSVVSAESQRLDPGETTVVNVSHAFDRPGHYRLEVGDLTGVLTVLQPATAATVDRRLEPAAPGPGEPATLIAEVHNPADRPGQTTVRFEVAGESLADKEVYLGPGESRTVSVTTEFESAGTHEVTIAGETLEVVVGGDQPPTATTGSTRAGEDATVPGFGVGLAVLAILGAAILLSQRG